jgi:hypothetical protein
MSVNHEDGVGNKDMTIAASRTTNCVPAIESLVTGLAVLPAKIGLIQMQFDHMIWCDKPV